MNRKSLTTSIIAALLAAQTSQTPQPAQAANLVITAPGRVSIELLTSESAYSNTLSVLLPTGIKVAQSGCTLQPADNLMGLRILSEKLSQRGCRVELDPNPTTEAIEGFPANTEFEFQFCAQTDGDPECEFTWSSNPDKNYDNKFNHLHITPLHNADYPGKIFLLEWEDWEYGGDNDFDDLVAILRVANDTDGDGLWDDWERFGIDTTGDGMADLTLPNADPNRRNVYLEVDYMACDMPLLGSDCAMGENWSHRPKAAALQKVIDAFANAPNPDGSTGIILHIEVGNAVPHQKSLGVMDCKTGQWGDFDAIKANPANFGPENPRRLAYHYALFAHRQQTGSTGSGCAEEPGNDLMVTLGGWNLTGTADDLDGDGLSDREVGTINQQAGTLMHELGHNLGLRHGGGDDVNQKPNYLSVMNGFFQFGIPPTDRLDYSRHRLNVLNELDLNEQNGIYPTTVPAMEQSDRTKFFCPKPMTGPALPGKDEGTGFIDWSCNGDGGVDLSVSNTYLNENDATETLVGFNDWANLKFDFHNTTDFDDGIHSPTPTHTEIDYPAFVELPGAVDLAAQQAISPTTATTAFAGHLTQFLFDVSNTGPVPAANITLINALPAGLIFDSITPNAACTHAKRVVTCTVAALSTFEHERFALSVRIDPTLPDGTTIYNTIVISQALNESNVLNNTVTTSLLVRRQSDLALTQTLRTSPVLAGRALAYDIEINNTGQSIATGVVLTNALPVGVAFDGPASSPNCREAQGLITCILGTLLDGSSKRVTLAGTASAALRGGDVLINTAAVSADGLDPDPANNVAINTALLRSQTYLPLLLNQPPQPAPSSQPDLVIKAITLTQQAVTVVIQNIGPGPVSPADEFWVDLYISPTLAPQAVNQTWQRLGGAGGLVWGISGSALPLGPQQTLTLTLNDVRFAAAESRVPALIPAGTAVYAQVDSANAQTRYGGVLETHEADGAPYNNISAITLTQPISTAQWLQRPASAAPATTLGIARP